MSKFKLNKIIIPLGISLFFLLFTYFGNQWYAEKFNVIGKDYSYIFYNFNQSVPFLSWTIYPYIIAYPFWFGAYVYISYRSEKNMYIISTIAIIAYTICGIWYFLWQSDVEAWRVTSGLFINNNYTTPRTDLSFSENIVMMIYQSAGPRNALPSMHTISSWIVIIGVRLDERMPKLSKIILWGISLAIIISTQTLKQHYIIDLIVGIFIAEGLFWIVFKTHIYTYFGRLFKSINLKLKLTKKED
ncbi:MAG TPA: phosphatase PAP2 family protein [Candidatus Izemoplasmatales bacterium]|nr:phosphatase PAP2 family protein [Candidatus Izemoplasmatales bacterium]